MKKLISGFCALVVLMTMFIASPVSAGSCRLSFSGGNLCLPAGHYTSRTTSGYILDVDDTVAVDRNDFSQGQMKINVSVSRRATSQTAVNALTSFSNGHSRRTDRIYNDSPLQIFDHSVSGMDDVLLLMFYNSALPNGSDFHGGAVSFTNTCGYTYTVETFTYGNPGDDVIAQVLAIYDSLTFYEC